ncbi:acyl-CoA dehydrogenase family protein [Brevibacterium album]|uniref:acyl-CoA dehydrogenase family protein n=1 Tax=Brevibacterium album TaxID=417948 RepID=UPI000424BB4B|nr:acyl-CoA dehydrogenase family protein [Brevibacterium album]
MYEPITRPEETNDLRALVRRICDDHQMPLEERILRGEQVSWEDHRPGREAAKEAGLWGLRLPESLGGADLSVYDLVNCFEEAARPLAQLRFAGGLPAALVSAEGEQYERYTRPILEDRMRWAFAQTEPSGGGDPGGALRTTAVRDGSNWVISGSKVFISGVDAADIVLVVALTDPDKRQRGGISLFAVEKDNPGLTIAREIEVLGGLRVHELFLDDCRVEESALLGAAGGGFAEAQKLLSTARMTVAATALGIADRALEMMISYARTRSVFGGPLSEKQAVQGFIVDSWTEIHQARLALYNAAGRTDAGHDTRVEAGMAKLLGTETVGRVLDRAIQVHGAAGTSLDSPLAHWYGLQRLSRIYEGPSEVQKYRVIARKLLEH